MAGPSGSGSLTNLIEDDVESYTINSGGPTSTSPSTQARSSSTASMSAIQLALPDLCRRRDARIVNRSTSRPQVIKKGINSHYLGYAFDHFTTIVNSPWWMVILIFSTAYVLSWLFFTCVWLFAAFVDTNGPNNSTCLVSVTDFNSAFLLSLETQVTIGYGNVNVAPGCALGSFVLIVQTLVGILIDAVMLGLIFAKITRPRYRRRTIVFSKQAVIYEEDGEQYFEVRIADLRQSQMVEAHVRLQLYWYELVDPINQRYKFRQRDLECGYDDGTDRVVLIMPVHVRHRIKEGSPLYNLNATKLSTMDHLEIVVVLEGIVEPTGLTAQALWSYTKDEILIGHEFAPIISRRDDKWEVDFSQIDAIVPVATATSPTEMSPPATDTGDVDTNTAM